MAKKAVWGIVAGGVAAAALATTMALAVPAAAATGGQAMAAGQVALSSTGQAAVAAAPGKTVPDKTALCDRLKKQQQKRQAVETRLSADANTRGSIAWLTAKASTAGAAGNPTLAQLYTDKAALRTQLLAPLKTVDTDLAAVVQANCS